MNLKVAICDDEKEWIETIKSLLKTYTIETDITFVISEFCDPDDLLKSYNGPGSYQLLFLDMEMPINGEMKKGIDFAKTLRAFPDNEIKIIFLSNYPQYMHLGYDVHASHYLEKGVSAKKFFSVLTDTISDMTREHTMIRIKTERDSWSLVRISDILYVFKPYAIRDKIIYHTLNGTLSEHKTMSQIETELEPLGFSSASKNYLVNFRHIQKFSNNYLILDTGEEIELSRHYRREFHEKFSHNILTIHQ
ncbi:MAG: response regulator transcription factor [Lachnospiraceae bacterium]|nr:response regulator transcription factor [Lachnospiraceae bacterium]